MPYDALLFDSDGVLVTPTPRAEVRRAVELTFASFDLEPASTDVETIAESADVDRLRQVAKTYGVPPEALRRAREGSSVDASESSSAATRSDPTTTGSSPNSPRRTRWEW